MRSRNRVFLAAWTVAVVAALSGCSPKIGDACATSTDCSVNGDRLCDTTQPGGYCTIFNCEPDTCPDESVCVAFDSQLDPRCHAGPQWSRFERTYCMFRCESDVDCRAGYICMDTTDSDDPLGARVVDLNPAGHKICVVPWSEQTNEGASDVCQPHDGGFPDVTSPEAGSDGGVDASEPPKDGAADTSSDASDAQQSVDASVDALFDVATEDVAVSDASDELNDAPDDSEGDLGDVQQDVSSLDGSVDDADSATD